MLFDTTKASESFDPTSAILFKTARVGRVELRNRLVFLPTTTMLDRDQRVTDELVSFYEARARGGVGLIITGNLNIVSSPPRYTTYPGIYNDSFVAGLRYLTEAVHAHDVPIVAQVGTMYHWQDDENSPLKLVAPSAVPIYRHYPEVLTEAQINMVIERFADAVRRARESGFDGAELLACQGSLINRFLSPATNHREDGYGGSIQNRASLLLQIISRCHELAGGDYLLGVRLSLDELIPGGMTVEDSLPLCEMLEAAGVDYLSVEVGWHESVIPHLQNVVEPGSLTYVSRAAKRVVGIPVITSQRINSVPLAESVLLNGDADLIGMARALIADPDLPRQAAHGRLDDIRPCICCMRCNEAVYNRQICCSVNPEAGYERQRAIKPTTSPKKVLVIGGGPAGLEAALVASQRGHSVELVERQAELGGQLREAALPPHKSEILEFAAYLNRQVRNAGTICHLGTTANGSLIEDIGPDAVILATGSQPVRPPIPGVDLPHVITYAQALTCPDSCGHNTLVIGGGLIGCETALTLAGKGKKVCLVDMLSKIGGDLGPMTRWTMVQQIEKAAIEVKTNTKVVEITAAGVVVEQHGKAVILSADTVVIAVGMTPNQELVETTRSLVPETYLAGDCVEPTRILEAVKSGYIVGCQV